MKIQAYKKQIIDTIDSRKRGTLRDFSLSSQGESSSVL